MIEKDKKEFRLMIGEALVQIVLPEIQGLKDDVGGLKKDVKVLKDDVKVLKDDVSDLKDTTTRIELLTNSVVKRQDEQGDQIKKINKVLKLEPKAG